jgi:hypothetical protein
MEYALNLKLAVADTCELDRCQVTLLDDGRSLSARYTAMMVTHQMKIYPGQLLAIDMDTVEPEIAWRWHRVRVLATSPEGASLEDPVGRRIDAVRVPGLASGLTSGDEVWITGFDPTVPTMEIHAKIIDNRPSQEERLKELILPRVAEQVASRSAK